MWRRRQAYCFQLMEEEKSRKAREQHDRRRNMNLRNDVLLRERARNEGN